MAAFRPAEKPVGFSFENKTHNLGSYFSRGILQTEIANIFLGHLCKWGDL